LGFKKPLEKKEKGKGRRLRRSPEQQKKGEGLSKLPKEKGKGKGSFDSRGRMERFPKKFTF